MLKHLTLAFTLTLALTSLVQAQDYPRTLKEAKRLPGGASAYNWWQGEACGNGGEPGSQCEREFKRLCGKTPNAACVKRHKSVFNRANKFR